MSPLCKLSYISPVDSYKAKIVRVILSKAKRMQIQNIVIFKIGIQSLVHNFLKHFIQDAQE